MSFLELARCSLYYEVDGSGPPLLFVHGGSCTHEDWKWQVSSLRDTRTAITVDLRGHGASRADPVDCNVGQYALDVCELLRVLGLGPAVLVGHSLGTRVVLQAARDHPELVAGLVLIDGSTQASGDAAKAEQVHAARFGDHERIAARLRPYFEGMFFENADPVHKARILAGLEGIDGEVAAMRSRATLLWDATELNAALDAVRVPVLALQGTYADETGVRRRLREGDSTPYLDRLRAHLAQLEVQIVPGVGHFVMLDAPDLVNESIRRFAAACQS